MSMFLRAARQKLTAFSVISIDRKRLDTREIRSKSEGWI